MNEITCRQIHDLRPAWLIRMAPVTRGLIEMWLDATENDENTPNGDRPIDLVEFTKNLRFLSENLDPSVQAAISPKLDAILTTDNPEFVVFFFSLPRSIQAAIAVDFQRGLKPEELLQYLQKIVNSSYN
jgi:hypothetical protein